MASLLQTGGIPVSPGEPGRLLRYPTSPVQSLDPTDPVNVKISTQPIHWSRPRGV